MTEQAEQSEYSAPSTILSLVSDSQSKGRVLPFLAPQAGGVRPRPKDLGTAIQVAQQWIRAAGLLSNRKLVSEIVKAEPAK
jgi:hypothetical protein